MRAVGRRRYSYRSRIQRFHPGISAGQYQSKNALHQDYDFKVASGKIVEENGLDDGVTALTQLGILTRVEANDYFFGHRMRFDAAENYVLKQAIRVGQQR